MLDTVREMGRKQEEKQAPVSYSDRGGEHAGLLFDCCGTALRHGKCTEDASHNEGQFSCPLMTMSAR